MSIVLSDGSARSQALDPARSFIVQAPAGSGKTGLLSLRFLKLLAQVEQPEQVVAITFTKKAAAEMKSRILEAIVLAGDAVPTVDFQKQAWDLAKEVVKRDRQLEWGLIDNPGRLRILTIDSLCSTISRQMPVLSRLGGAPDIVEDSQPLFLEAARTTINHIDGDGELGKAVEVLLDHLDNNLNRVETLLGAMLSRREQWLRHVTGRRGVEVRKLLEESLEKIVFAEVRRVKSLIPNDLFEEIILVAREAGRQLQASGVSTGELAKWADIEEIAKDEKSALPALIGLGELLLTNSGSWRKTFTYKTGFPAPSNGRNPQEKAALKKSKARAGDLVVKLSRHDLFRLALHGTRALPPIRYNNGQWAILSALLNLLPVCAAHLKVLFSENRVVDFSEVSQSALYALGESDRPTDLALKLDYQISHLLVDEFQDTSRSQYELIKRLVAGWGEESGNTLFLVGDPMQSIYRFREAEVGLFLQARMAGIPPVKLTPLSLKVNFRSKAGIVNWVNSAMGDIFPIEEHISVGAVPYSDSVSFHPVGSEQAVSVHPMPPKDVLAEAGQVAAITAKARQEGFSVAVLVRSRNHLAHILPAFEDAGLRYQAVELHPLAGRPMIQDLLALTRALNHPADRIAWLAILRAPWCGLSVADIYQLVAASDHKKVTVWQIVADDDLPLKLSLHGRQRLLRFKEVMGATLKSRGRGDHFPGAGEWRRWVEGCWLALGGPATLAKDAELLDAETFFDLVETVEGSAGRLNLLLLNKKLEKLYAATDPHADPDLTVMTLHKAKGLEFDVVILPGLDRRTRGEERRLLTWLDGSLDDSSEATPLLAPIGRSDQEAEDEIQAYIRNIEKQKSSYETARLLYVAVTRAKQQLHLLAGTVEEGKKPQANSFLATLWPVLNEPFTKNQESSEEAGPGWAELTVMPDRALPAGWQMPELPDMVVNQGVVTQAEISTEEPVLFDWAGDTARLLGLVVHRYLSKIADDGVISWSAERVERQHSAISAHLLNLSIPKKHLAETVGRVKLALTRSIKDKRGRWILDANHLDSRSELSMSGFFAGRRIRAIIDRSFIDSNGTRWIIDFKTSFHAGGGLDGFLDNESIRYQDQLNRYGLVFSKLEDRPIRLGLYFPLLSGWREWAYEDDVNNLEKENISGR
ncbi:MAG: UvrD-helicase domain-containing protein [Magnetococcales bacterium]|nr:UvrD-helicase domain-containing protein [Magnetococcales bacterium]